VTQSFEKAFIGIHSADAERVSLSFKDGDLTINYIDWQERAQSVALHEVFAFKWQERDSDSPPRDDTTYQVIQSEWLHEQTFGLPGAQELVHFKVLFNACGVLDIICPPAPSDPGRPSKVPGGQ
jgi:hypothetical protein